MAVLIDTENEVRAFLRDKSSAEDFETWVISILEDVSGEERDALLELRLLLTEYGENLRSIDDVKSRAAQLLSDSNLELRLTDSENPTITESDTQAVTSGSS